MYEKNLYPAMEKFLRTQKNCLSEYFGNELSLKRGITKNMLELQKKHHKARMERDKELYERQIKIVDAQIDQAVYKFVWADKGGEGGGDGKREKIRKDANKFCCDSFYMSYVLNNR